MHVFTPLRLVYRARRKASVCISVTCTASTGRPRLSSSAGTDPSKSTDLFLPPHSSIEGQFGAIWDRGSLVAINPRDREK